MHSVYEDDEESGMMNGIHKIGENFSNEIALLAITSN